MSSKNSFYIKSVKVESERKKESIIEFTPNLNILIGPSNAGKTKVLNCIAYVFGKDDARPFDEKYHGYNKITVCLCSSSGRTTSITRVLDSQEAFIDSSEEGIEKGTYYYSSRKDSKSVNHVLFSVIGIKNTPFELARNEKSKKERISWGYVLRLLYLDSTKLLSKKDFIQPVNSYEQTPFLSLLLYLIYGKEFSFEPREDKKITKAKFEAKSEYISEYISRIKTKIEKNRENIEQRFGSDVPPDMAMYSEKLEEITCQINECIEKSNILIAEIMKTSEELKERQLSKNSFKELLSQYSADIDRLNSIVLGGELLGYITTKDHCPFCNNKISKDVNELNIEAANSDLSRILNLYNGLVETQKGVISEIEQLEKKIEELNAEKNIITRHIDDVLKPSYDEISGIISLTDEYNQLKTQERLFSEIVVDMEKDDDSLKKEYSLNNEKAKKERYRPKEHFQDDFVNKMSLWASEILHSSGYKKYDLAYFRLDNFEIDLKGVSKNIAEGQGYRTFINTVLYLALMKYLSTEAVYSLGFLMLDTPLMGLEEKLDIDERETIHERYTETLVELGNFYQLIITYQEEDLPKAFDRTKCRVIPLKAEGKNGFLADYDSENR